MNLLALDTSTEQLSLALSVNGVISHIDEMVGNASSAFVLPKIRLLLDEADLSMTDLDGIAFGSGPGSFTGVRIAAGVTQGLAFGANLPVVGIVTLLALAEASGADKVIACLDARMGEVYHAAYIRQDGEWHTQIEPGVYKPEMVPLLDSDGLDGQHWVGAGSGWKTYPEVLQTVYKGQLTETLPDLMPSAIAILTLASPIFQRGEAVSANQAMPIYIRNRVAMTTLERQQAAAK